MPSSYKVRPDGSLQFKKPKHGALPTRLTPIPDYSGSITHSLARRSHSGSGFGEADTSGTPAHPSNVTSATGSVGRGHTSPPQLSRSGAASVPPPSSKEVTNQKRKAQRQQQEGEDHSSLQDGLLATEKALEGFVDGGTPPPPPRLKLPEGALIQGRDSVLWLEASLQDRLKNLSQQSELSRHDFVSKSQEIFNDVAVELTRQVSAQCTDRGRLLAKLWVRYSDLINIFSNMFIDERQRHKEEEEKLAAQLRKVRVDYVTLVQHTEKLLKEQYQRQEKLVVMQEDREKGLCTEIHQLKEDLYRAQVALRVKPIVKPKYPTGAIDASYIVNKPSDSPPKKEEVDEEEGRVDHHPRSSPPASDAGSPTTAVPPAAMDIDTLLSAEAAAPEDDALTAALKQQVRDLRLTLVDASTELVQHRSQKELMYSRGINTDPPCSVTNRASSPIPEITSTLPDIELTEPDPSPPSPTQSVASSKGKPPIPAPGSGRPPKG